MSLIHDGLSTDHLVENISLKDFRAVLEQYPTVIAQVSSSKPSKSESLKSLDEYRYESLPSTLSARKLPSSTSSSSSKAALTKDELLRLVRWKVTHGTFRPTLLPLVTSNSEDQIHSTTASAFSIYTADAEEIPKALKTLCELRGIGPATASLILSIYDPENVPFFSDEAFRWMCWNNNSLAGKGKGSDLKGWARKMKYSDKEYEVLRGEVAKLTGRLGVSAVEVEKFAWVLGMEGSGKVNGTEGKMGVKRKAESEARPISTSDGRKRASRKSAKKSS
jgi:hypothetical protein